MINQYGIALVTSYHVITASHEFRMGGHIKHLSRHYHFKLADDVCDQYNRLINLMRKEEEKSEGKFLWLDDTDERKIYD